MCFTRPPDPGVSVFILVVKFSVVMVIGVTLTIHVHIVQQQRDHIFEVPKPAVQHLSTCLELFSGISRYRIWLMTLPEMGAG